MSRTRDAFGSRVARRLLLSYTIPLVVLVVAGLLLPLFLWIWLDQYRVDYENQADLVTRAAALRRAAMDTDEALALPVGAAANVRRRVLAEARDAYRTSAVEVRDWMERYGEPRLRSLYRDADQTYRRWLRTADRSSDAFGPTQDAMDLLLDESIARRNERLDEFRQINTLRRSAFFVIPILAMALALLIGRSVAVSITDPLVALTHAAVRIEQGESDPLLLDAKSDPPDEIGDLRRAFRSMSDAIARREAVLRAQNEALAAIGRRIESVLNATDEGIAMLDRRGVFSVVNERFTALLGIEAVAILDHPFARLSTMILSRFRDPASARHRLREVMRSPDAVVGETFEMAGDRRRILRIFSAPVRGELTPGEGVRVLGRIVVLRDVTRETEVDRMKTEFVSTVSHELRTPLTAIKGYLDLILGGQTGPLTETQREFLSLTSDSTERLTALINDILDISRIEQGGGNLRRVATSYSPIVRHALQMLSGQAKARSITVDSTLPQEEIVVEGDPDRISQVLFNLLSNGLKYTPPGGRVHVAVECDDLVVTTHVADTGIGIPVEDHGKVFERFYRADNSSTRETGGTGLGLGISRAIIERMRGTISVDSVPGKGSVFTFTLPRSQPDQVAADGDDGAAAPRLYLLVDGDPDTRNRLANTLRQHRIAISAAATNGEAWRRARGLRPDLILIDPLSPGIDGPALLASLRTDEATRKIPVLLTGALDAARLVRTSAPGDLSDALRTFRDASDGPVWVFGSDALVQAVRDAAPDANLVRAGEESDDELLTEAPCAAVVAFGGAVGDRLRELRVRFAPMRIGMIVAGDFADNVAPIGMPGGGAVPYERYARLASDRLTRDDALRAPEELPT